MLTNELKKGMRVLLRGTQWEADVWDNAKGQTRVCLVYGFETEAGSVYSHDIQAVLVDAVTNVPILNVKEPKATNGKWLPITHNDKQKKLKQTVEAMGF